MAAYHLIVHDPSMGSLHNHDGQARARLCPIRGLKGCAVLIGIGEASEFPILRVSIAIIRIPGKSSGVQSAHGCVAVLGGRQPARVLRLALHALSAPPFLSRILKLAIDSPLAGAEPSFPLWEKKQKHP